MNPHIEQAVQAFRVNSVRYAKTERYYRGDHDLSFATEKFLSAFGVLFRQFALNLCPAICDAVRDKLKVTSFGIAELGTRKSALSVSPLLTCGLPHPASGDPGVMDGGELRELVDRVWRRNRMGVRAGEVHKEALKNGDAFVIVWFDQRGEVTTYPQRAGNCMVCYDEDMPGRVLWAAKWWRDADEKRTRLNLYYPDRIEFFATKKGSEDHLPDPKEFVPVVLSGDRRFLPPRTPTTPSAEAAATPPRAGGELRSPSQEGSWENAVANPFGVVPVFHFANNSDVGMAGRSELEQAIPIQDGLNKSVLDMLVAMEYSAFRQRWVAGVTPDKDENTGKPIAPFKSGVDHVWVAADPAAKFGDFGTTELDQFLKVKDSFRVDMAGVTGTPLHYFLQNTRGFASGEALRKAETRFIAKVRDRQAAFGQVWSDVMAFAARLAGHEGVELITHWEDPAPLTERELLENLILKKQLGLPTGQVLKEAGYGDEDVKGLAQSP